MTGQEEHTESSQEEEYEEEEYESEQEIHEGRDSDNHDINFEPCITQSINACEDRFTGMMKWPSLGGTYNDFVKAVESLQSKDTGHLITIGLRAEFDESSNICCDSQGNVTGLLHMIVYPGDSIRAARHIWDKIVQIDKDGRKQGFYSLTIHSNWLNIL